MENTLWFIKRNKRKTNIIGAFIVYKRRTVTKVFKSMKGLRNTTILEFLNNIQIKAKANVSRINQNNLKIEELKQLSRNNNIESSDLVDRLRRDNKELIEENSMLLNLHQKILSFSNQINSLSDVQVQEKNFHEPKIENKIEEPQNIPSQEECVDWILNNKLSINEDNPCMCDDKIVDEIYQILVKNERYEECEILLKLKERHQVGN
jgi:hypothetical protein